MPNANIKAVITAEDKASSVLKNFGKNVDKTSESVMGGLNASTLAVTAATAGIVAFGKKSLDAFNQQDLATVRLQAGINNVTSATSKNIKALTDQASALQKTTRFSDEQYISAQGILSTFQLNQSAIEKLTPRLADMSEGLARINGGLPDLEGNAILVAKAIGGEDVAGLSGALRRAGVVLTDTQTKILETGTKEERIATITQALDQNFAHLATTAGETTAGKLAILKNQFNEVEEKVGQVIANALTPLLNVLNQHPAILTAVVIAIGTLTAAFVALKVAAAIGAVMSAASAAIAGVGAAATATAGAFSGMIGVLASPVTLAIAGAIADLFLVKKAVDSVTGAFQALKAAKDAQGSLDSGQQELLNLSRSSDPNVAARAKKGLHQIGYPGYASGTDYAQGGMALVGEQGPELVNLPQGSQVIPNDRVGGGSNVNVTFNGIFTGSEMEFRKLAVKMMAAYSDAKGMGTI